MYKKNDIFVIFKGIAVSLCSNAIPNALDVIFINYNVIVKTTHNTKNITPNSRRDTAILVLGLSSIPALTGGRARSGRSKIPLFRQNRWKNMKIAKNHEKLAPSTAFISIRTHRRVLRMVFWDYWELVGQWGS